MHDKALFLDRDGTVNVEKNFIGNPDDLQLTPGAAEALRLAAAAGYKLFVVSNQSGVARGIMTEEDVSNVNQRLVDLLSREDVHLDGIEYCPHHPDFTGPCDCRKPKRGMVDRLLKRFQIDLAGSWVIGDRVSEVALSHNIGARAVLVLTGYGQNEAQKITERTRPDRIAVDLLAAVKWILSHE